MKTVLVNEVLSYILLGQKEVFLSIPGDKKHNVQVKKEINKPFSELTLPKNEFKLKLLVRPNFEGVLAYIKSDLFPNSEEWYLVKNFMQESSCQILAEVENNNGEFSDDKIFETVFIESKVSFITSGMSNYKPAMDEMTRRFYIEIGRKTKKWIPGHRYDCAEGTYYYLGKYLARKKEEYNSTFYNTPEDLKEIHIYSTKLDDGDKKISDVFKHGSYRENLFVIWNDVLPSCVDSGSVLEDDSPSLHDLYVEMFNNSTPNILPTSTPNLKYTFDVLCYLSYSDSLGYSEGIKKSVSDILITLIKNVVYNNWNITRLRSDREIGDHVSRTDNIERIKFYLLNNTIGDGNILNRFYYDGLFKSLSIDLDELINNWLDGWNENDLTSSFDAYKENVEYFLKRVDSKKITSTQRKGDKLVKISDLFGKGELGTTLVELVNYALNNYGEGVSDFNAVKINRTLNSYSCVIKLDDVLKFKNTENLKEDLLLNRFSKIIVFFDKDIKVE